MKIRSGFVSNSSSTSFCIIYKDIDNFDSEKAGIISECWEGPVVFTLSKEMKDYFKKQLKKGNDPQHDYRIVEILYEFDEGDHKINKEEFIEILKTEGDLIIYNSEGSINCPYNMESFEDWFNGD